jgi:hypothetical protein
MNMEQINMIERSEYEPNMCSPYGAFVEEVAALEFKDRVIELLRHDPQVRYEVIGLVRPSPYVMTEIEGGCQDVDFL